MKAAPFEYIAAETPAQAVALLADAEAEGTTIAKVCGGSQSLGPMLNLRLAQVDRLIDLSRLEVLRGFALRGEGAAQVLRIGAAVTHARIEDGALPDVTHGLLPAVAADIAYRAVRNRGTLGGSLAHADPAADWVTTMCLLDATMVLLGTAGERSVRFGDFFIGPFTTALAPDEVLVAVDVPCFSTQARWAYRKTCRKPGEFADAIAAAWIDPPRGIARAVIGSLDGMPHVVDGADAVAALGQPGGISRLLDAAGVDDPYGREVHAAMLRRTLADLAAPRA